MDPSITSYPMMAPFGTIGGSHTSVTVLKVLFICCSTVTCRSRPKLVHHLFVHEPLTPVPIYCHPYSISIATKSTLVQYIRVVKVDNSLECRWFFIFISNQSILVHVKYYWYEVSITILYTTLHCCGGVLGR